MRTASLSLDYCGHRLALDVHLLELKMENLRSLRRQVAQIPAEITVTAMSAAEWNPPSKPEVVELLSSP
jgi:hypothetical protein